ncbi:unnamed protein product, partial [Scytosiphon promiscuus]
GWRQRAREEKACARVGEGASVVWSGVAKECSNLRNGDFVPRTDA